MSFFQSRIKELRGKCSYKQFERKTGVPAATLERLEKIGADIKSGQIISICTTYGVTADWLLGLDSKSTPSINAHNSTVAIGVGGNMGGDCSRCPLAQAALNFHTPKSKRKSL